MDEWTFAQSHPSEELAQLHFFSMKKPATAGQPATPALPALSVAEGSGAEGAGQGAEIEFVITVRESATPKDNGMRFFAQADKQTNQKTAAFTPCGWGDTLLKALAECVQAVHRFPYEGREQG